MKRSSAGDKNSKTIFWTLIAVFFFYCFAFDAGADDEADLRVTRMEWRSDNSELRVSGRGAGKRRTVSIEDAESGAVLGDTRSRRDGRWEFRKRNLAFAPCSILVESEGGQVVTADYTRNEPAICGDTPQAGRTLEGITISGPLQVDQNSESQYVCEAQYSDGTSENISGLAQWTVDPANPLTARVTVNRFWQQLFGRGIVATPEDFGVMGALPTHPELLDWLAVDFRDSGWDVKRFFKQVLMSAAYRQSAAVTPQKLEADRENLLLSRGPRFRMDAEMVRDGALAASGLLSAKMHGPGVKPYQPGNIWDVVGLPGGNTRDYVQAKGEDLYRRTIYTFWKRMAPPPNLDAFNAPSREFCSVRRERTNTPLQALVTLNDPTFVEAARRLAEQSLRSGAKDDGKVLDHAALQVLARPLKPAEQKILMADLAEFSAYYQQQAEHAKALISVGDSKADEKLDAQRLAAWTLVCNQVFNLDEALNK